MCCLCVFFSDHFYCHLFEYFRLMSKSTEKLTPTYSILWTIYDTVILTPACMCVRALMSIEHWNSLFHFRMHLTMNHIFYLYNVKFSCPLSCMYAIFSPFGVWVLSEQGFASFFQVVLRWAHTLLRVAWYMTRIKTTPLHNIYEKFLIKYIQCNNEFVCAQFYSNITEIDTVIFFGLFLYFEKQKPNI